MRGHRLVGEPEQRARPWSTVFRVETDAGVVWSKANGPGPLPEARLLTWLVERGETLPLAPLAVDLERGWLVTPDAGSSLRATPSAEGRPGDQDLRAWTRILPAVAAFQRRLAPWAEALVALGVPDERPDRYRPILDGFLADDRIWARVDPAGRDGADDTRRRLERVRSTVGELAAALGASPLAPSLDHGDLHGNNVVWQRTGRGSEVRLLDWGDAVVAHPFATLTTTLGSLAQHLGVDPDGPALDRVRDAHLRAWSELASMPDLRAWAALAIDLGQISKAAGWERALEGLEPNEMAGFHGATAAVLGELAGRLERRRSLR